MLTKQELSQYKQYGREIRLYEEERSALHQTQQKQDHAAQVVRGSLPEFPYTMHSVLVEGEDVYNKEWKQKATRLDRKIKALLKRRLAIEAFIEVIPDSVTRQVFTLRFIRGLSWEQAARKMGVGYTADALRMRVGRYLMVCNKYGLDG